MQKMNILVVEDGPSQRKLLRDFLLEEGHHVSEAGNGESALEQVRKASFDLLFVDYKMPGLDGLTVLEEVKKINPEIDVIMMTAYGSIDTAVKVMKAGAVDYITKPVDLEQILLQIERISERQTLFRENKILKEDLRAKGLTSDQIIYRSRVMAEVINLAGRVAPSQATVLIQGESGTGKEMFARLVHSMGPFSEKPMITVNCAALPENLLESELFGHEKGAFTGALKRRIGRFEEADQSTLFLDEIGEVSPAVQVKILRFLQEREFQRIGGNQTIHSEVRIISATNSDLRSKIKKGDFREDLYYRLNVVAINVPPLRERREDISPLIDHFLEHFALQNGKEVPGIQPEAKDLLLKYDYPGNVRELENIIERAVVISRGPQISARDLPFSNEASLTERGSAVGHGTLKDALDALERTMIQDAMGQAGNHQTKAADLLGISERMLRYKLKKHGLR